MHKVSVIILIDSSVGIEYEGLDPFRLLEPANQNILPNELKNINLGGNTGSIESGVEAEVANELLEDDVVLRHHLLPHSFRKAHHLTNNILNIDEFDYRAVDF